MKKFIERRVLVEFKLGITAKQQQDFFYGINMLAEQWQPKVTMELFKHQAVDGESKLDAIVSGVNTADVMSVWKFTSQEDLENFIQDPMHLEIARNYFKPAVKHRTIINVWL